MQNLAARGPETTGAKMQSAKGCLSLTFPGNRPRPGQLFWFVLVIALSATEDRVKGIKAGADEFLSKPFDQSELLAHVRSLLSLKAYTDELERAESVLFALAAVL